MVSDVLRLRQGQTLRTIGLLKEKYPGLRLYLWGHSEGGAVVQSLDADVAGIMVSGEECGFWEQPVGAPDSVPFLYFLGANDPYIDWSLLSESGKDMKKCLKRMGRHDWRLVVVQDNSHLVFPWRQEAQEAVAEFLGVEWHGVNPPIVDPKLIHNAKLTTSVAQYSSQPEHRALAYGPNGAFFWYSGWENAEDVAQAALFSCASQLGSNVFMSGNHLCALLDVDGKEHRAAAN